jgi:hypothetical protein
MAKVGIYPVEFTASIRLFLVTKTEVTIDTYALGLRFDAGTTYTVELEEGFVKETGANKFDSPAVSNLSQFTTNFTGPQVQVDEPAGNNVINNTFIRYTYDRQILAGNGNYYLYKETGSPDEEVTVFNPSDSTGATTISNNQITLDVTGLMRAGETYYVLIDEGAVEDKDGLAAFGFDNDQEHRWTTASDATSTPLVRMAPTPLVGFTSFLNVNTMFSGGTIYRDIVVTNIQFTNPMRITLNQAPTVLSGGFPSLGSEGDINEPQLFSFDNFYNTDGTLNLMSYAGGYGKKVTDTVWDIYKDSALTITRNGQDFPGVDTSRTPIGTVQYVARYGSYIYDPVTAFDNPNWYLLPSTRHVNSVLIANGFILNSIPPDSVVPAFPDLSATLTGAFTPTVAISYQAGFVASQSMVATINCSAGRIRGVNSQMTSQSTINLTDVTWVMYSNMSSSFTMPAVFTEATVPASAALVCLSDMYAFGHRGEYGQTLTFSNPAGQGLESLRTWRGYGNTNISLDLSFNSNSGVNESYNLENNLYPSILDDNGMFHGGDEFSVGKNKRWVISYQDVRGEQNYTTSSTNYLYNNFYFTFYENTNSTWTTSGNYEYKQHFTQDDVFTSSEISELSGSNSQYYRLTNEYKTLHMSDTEEYAVSVISPQPFNRPYLLLFSKSGSTWSVSKKNILNLPNLGSGSPGSNAIPDVKISGNGQYIFVRHNTATDTKLYIYHNNNGTLTLQHTLDISILQAINSNFNQINSLFNEGQLDVNYDGSKLALVVATNVGQYPNPDRGTHILIFTRSGSTWSHTQTIDSGTDKFGNTIEINGVRMNTSGTRFITAEGSANYWSTLVVYDFETNVGFVKNGRLEANLNFSTNTFFNSSNLVVNNNGSTADPIYVEFDYADNNKIILWESANYSGQGVNHFYILTTPTI